MIDSTLDEDQAKISLISKRIYLCAGQWPTSFDHSNVAVIAAVPGVLRKAFTDLPYAINHQVSIGTHNDTQFPISERHFAAESKFIVMNKFQRARTHQQAKRHPLQDVQRQVAFAIYDH